MKISFLIASVETTFIPLLFENINNSLLMATIQELKLKADELKKQNNFHYALPVFREIWDNEKTDWNGYNLVQCLRKTSSYSEARELHGVIKSMFPNFKALQNEELWLDYNEKIKNWQNENLISDADRLLARTNKYDQYTGSIFSKTVLAVVKHLIYKANNPTALTWLDKLDFTVLSNSPFTIQGQKYASDQKVYFVRYADVLINLDKHIQYLESSLLSLRIEGIKQTQFLRYIIDSISYQDYNNNIKFSRLRFGLYLKYFKEEIYNRSKNTFTRIYNQNKITLISDIADFEFCPVSFAINETYFIPSNEAWEKDEWLGEKKLLIDRYNKFQADKNIIEVFNDTTIEINDSVIDDFNDIFNAKILYSNHDGFFSNISDTIKGNPEYVFQSANSKKFVVVEKFTKKTPENITTAFSNDLIKLYGYIFELTSLNIDYAYLIYWYWQIDDIQDNSGSIRKK